MLDTTKSALRSIISADASLSLAERTALLRRLTAKPEGETPKPDTGPRIMRRAEAAERLGRSLRAVDLLAEAGILRRVILPGRSRGAGFRAEDIQALIEGRAES